MPTATGKRKSKKRRDARKSGNQVAPATGIPSISPGLKKHLQNLILLFLFVLPFLIYVNADHEQFLFDGGAGVIAGFDQPGTVLSHWAEQPLVPEQYRFTALTYALNAEFNRLMGWPADEVSSYLAVNMLIHAINACLLFLLLQNFLQKVAVGGQVSTWIPFAVALWFVVHPMHASSVAYIMQRRGLLAATFYMFSVFAFLKTRLWVQDERDGTRWPVRRIAWAISVPLFYWLSMHSKVMALTLPVTLLAVEFILRAPDRKARNRFLVVVIPLLVAWCGAVMAYLWRLGYFDPASFSFTMPGPDKMPWGGWVHFLTESRAFVHYWKLLLLPLPQWSSIDHGFALSHGLLEHLALLAILFHVLLLSAGVYAAMKRYALAATGIFWFYIVLIPYILLPQEELLVEYKTYMPAIGLGFIFAEGLWRLRGKLSLPIQATGVAAIAAILLGITIARNQIYQSPLHLWADAMQKNPDKYRPYANLGDALVKRGRYEKALPYFRRAVECEPHNAAAHYNLATTLEALNKLRAAEKEYRRTIELDPQHPMAHNNLAAVLHKRGQSEEAIAHFQKALELTPKAHKGEIHFNLAALLEEHGSTEKAVQHYRKALQYDSQNIQAMNNLGLLLMKRGKIEEAIALYKKGLDVRADSARLHHNLGQALLRRPEANEAIQHFRRAVELQPGFYTAQISLGKVLLQQRRANAAVPYLREACRLNPREPYGFMLWSQALAMQNNIAEAARVCRHALQQHPQSADLHTQLALLFQRQNQLAKAQQHYRRALQLEPTNARAKTGLQQVLERIKASSPTQ